jgi:hypothetical protein
VGDTPSLKEVQYASLSSFHSDGLVDSHGRLRRAHTFREEKKISKKEVPAAVLSAFEKAYPHANIKGTSTEVENYYEIESMDGKQARDILYLPDGTATEIEEAVAVNSLPDLVKSAVEKEFVGAKVAKAEKVTKGEGVSYEIHVTLGAKKGSAVVDPSGKILKKKALAAKHVKGEKEEKGEEAND